MFCCCFSRQNSSENSVLSDDELKSFEVSSISSQGSLESFVGSISTETTALYSTTNEIDYEKVPLLFTYQ
jgi:hypothetical protein